MYNRNPRCCCPRLPSLTNRGRGWAFIEAGGYIAPGYGVLRSLFLLLAPPPPCPILDLQRCLVSWRCQGCEKASMKSALKIKRKYFYVGIVFRSRFPGGVSRFFIFSAGGSPVVFPDVALDTLRRLYVVSPVFGAFCVPLLQDPSGRIDFQFDEAGFDFKALPFNIPYPVPFRLFGDEV